MADPIRRKRSWRYGVQPAVSGNSASASSLRNQLARHSVALISLALAAASLGYNTWRNETSEQHRNWRQASFQVLIETGELEQVVLYRRYFQGLSQHADSEAMADRNWVTGWGKVAMIRDLTSLMPAPLPAAGQNLHQNWSSHAEQLNAIAEHGDAGAAEEASSAILGAINQTRNEIVALIQSLE